LIEAIYQTLTKILNPNMNENISNGQINRIPIIMGAYTGKAAYHIKGYTLHTLFRLPTKLKGAMPRLKDDDIEKLNRIFNDTVLLIIDEISMCGASIFERVCHRLMDIKKSDKLFGGISVLVVGDFNQLLPIQDTAIFKQSTENPYSNLVSNGLWSLFKMHELTECMRHRDDLVYARILSKIGNEGIYFCNDDEINLLDTRVIRQFDDIPDECMILCCANENVRKYNELRIHRSGGEIITNNAVHWIQTVDGEKVTSEAKSKLEVCKNKVSLDETLQMPKSLLLKLGKRYMLTYNINTSDGLCNGTVGKLMKITMSKEKKDKNGTPLTAVLRVWIKFDDVNTGLYQRTDQERLRERDDDQVDSKLNWTPFETTEHVIFSTTTTKKKYQIHRRQFQMVECEAMTIHKSQGQTYSSVAIDLNENHSQRLLYVALSRCTKLSGLYLFNGRSILKKIISESKKSLLRQQIKNEPARKEIERMRNDPYRNIFKCLDINYENNGLSVMFLNVCNIGKNFEKLNVIINDFGFRNADLILLVECHTVLDNFMYITRFNQNSNISFELVPNRLTYGNWVNSSHGQIGLVRKGLTNGNITFIGNNTKLNCSKCRDRHPFNGYCNSTNDRLEISLYRFEKQHKLIYIVSIYLHPLKTNNEAFRYFTTEFMSFINSHFGTTRPIIEQMFIIGDFNFDFTKNEAHPIYQSMNDLGFRSSFRAKTYRNFANKSCSQLDWIFTNIENYKSSVYTSWFTDHAPIFTTIET